MGCLGVFGGIILHVVVVLERRHVARIGVILFLLTTIFMLGATRMMAEGRNQLSLVRTELSQLHTS